MKTFFALLVLLSATAAQAQSFPALSGRVVDAANILSAQEEAALTATLAGLEKQSGRQLVVVTIADLEGFTIEDYGYRLGRSWGIGSATADDGVLLLVAPKDRKVRIEVGYGLTPIVTDALSSIIIRNAILPHFQEGKYGPGIRSGVDALVGVLRLPGDQARARAQQIIQAGQEQEAHFDPGQLVVLLVFGGILFLFLFRHRRAGTVHRSGRAPVIVWGPGTGGWGQGAWGGGTGGGGFSGGGGLSGGGGSFGGGGASGSW